MELKYTTSVSNVIYAEMPPDKKLGVYIYISHFPRGHAPRPPSIIILCIVIACAYHNNS